MSKSNGARPIDPAFEERVRQQLRAAADAQQVPVGFAPRTLHRRSRERIVRQRVAVGMALAGAIAVVASVISYERRQDTRIESAYVPVGIVPGSSALTSTTQLGTTTSATEGTHPTATAAATTAPPTTTTAPIEYVVKDGDLLYTIAQAHDTTQEAIAELNGWADGIGHPLDSGMKILLPRS